MTDDSSNHNKRGRTRIQKRLNAFCEINGSRYKARTFDISENGMTLLVTPELPIAEKYTVFCALPTGVWATFQVQEKSRKLMTVRDLTVLRIGVNLLSRKLIRYRERRSQTRFRKGITAWCEVEGRRFRARTYDINENGLALVTSPELPDFPHFLVRCELETGVSAVFEVEVKQRREIKRDKLHLLRLGLSILNETMDTVIFFRALAELQFKEGVFQEKLEKEDLGRVLRSRSRLSFQLPVLVETVGSEYVYRCNTMDVDAGGLSLATPPEFPTADWFRLVCIDPGGQEVVVKALEKNRRPMANGQLRVGFRVVEGNIAFRSMVARYT